MNPASDIPVLVTMAVPAEAAPLMRRVRGRPIRLAGAGLAASARAWRTDSGWVLVTGMGRANTRRAVEWLLDCERPARILTAGFAGGLNPGLSTGTVLAAAGPGGFPGFAEILASGARAGSFVTRDHVVVDVPGKAALWQSHGADAVEMESSEVMAIASCRGIPAATVRVVSDSAGEPLPLDFNRLMTPAMELDPWRFAAALARSPGTVVELIRFQRRISAAAERLADVLASVLGSAAGRA